MRRLLLILLLASLAGCGTTRFAYNRLDWIANWQIGRYVDLNDTQRVLFESHFAALWDWHRRHELPRYAADLDALASAIADGTLDRALLDENQRIVNAHVVRLYERALPNAALLLGTLDDDQLTAMRERLRKNAAREDARYRKLGLDGWHDEMTRDMLRGLRRWIGRATPAQRDRIRDWAEARMATPALWLDYRQAWTDDFFVLLDDRRDANFSARLRDRLEGRDGFRSEALNAAADADRESWLQLMLDLHASLEPRQRAHMVRELRRFAEDFETLAAQTRPA